MFCLDEWPDDFELGNETADDEYNRLELIVTPCNYIHSHLGYETLENGYEVPDECIPDFEQQVEYLGPCDVITYVTSDRFFPTDFSDSPVKRGAKFLHR